MDIDKVCEALVREEICAGTLKWVESKGGWSRWGTGFRWCHVVTVVALLAGGMDGSGDAWPKYRRLSVGDHGNNKKRSHTQLDSRKQVIAFQDRVITINIKEAQHPLKREKQVIDKSSIMLKISTKSMHRVLV